MLPYNAKDLTAAFLGVRKHTIQIGEEFPEDTYSFIAAPGTRSVARLLVHIAVADGFQRLVQEERRTTLAGVDFPALLAGVMAEEQKPRSKAEILTLLRDTGTTFAAFVEPMPDEFLSERVTMPRGSQPATKTRFEMLMGVKEHEMHHRGQLMLIERMLGITPHLTRLMMERLAAVRT
jgi:uncharacterized damage-inducible protein DinB